MHLVFERSTGRFRSNCNILALAWTPYYNETKFRLALFDYHQRQLMNLTSSIGINDVLLGPPDQARVASHPNAGAEPGGQPANGGQSPSQVSAAHNASDRPLGLPPSSSFLNSRLAELHQRYSYLRSATGPNPAQTSKDQRAAIMAKPLSGSTIAIQLDAHYGRMPDFGWLVVGNVGKIVGVTLTSTIGPPPQVEHKNKTSTLGGSDDNESDLMHFHEEPSSAAPPNNNDHGRAFRPDDGSLRSNYNLRGHLDEIILVKWNELYQKLATIDSKGNVLIWCKINEKFTIQTPFYNRTKSVADFKWSNDGKTALICYTDSFILAGSSSGQRHWHSMLNLDDYHITCASWTPNDEQLLLGVSNGNVVVIDLPRSELTELVVNQTNIRTMCWSSSDLSVSKLAKVMDEPSSASSEENGSPRDRKDSSTSSKRSFSDSRRHSTVVNHRRLSRDCSVFSRYRFCSQAPSNVGTRSPGGGSGGGSGAQVPEIANALEPRVFTFGSSQIRSDWHQDGGGSNAKQQRNILAIDFANNTIKLYDGGLDDPEPRTIHVHQESYIMHWSSDGKCLAVAGFNIHTTAPSVGCLRCRYLNAIKFYNQMGQLIYEHIMSYTRYPITAFTWAHDDRRLFVATGPRLHCAKVFMGIPPLSLLAVSCFQRHTKIPDKGDILDMIIENKFICSSVINWQSHNCPINLKRRLSSRRGTPATTLPDKLIFAGGRGSEEAYGCSEEADNRPSTCNNSNVYQFKLPLKLQAKIDNLFTLTIRQPFDEHWSLNDIIWHVPHDEQRHYCTMVCYTSERDINSSGHQYRTNLMDRGSLSTDNHHTSDQNKIFVLYVEFQGSLIPILRARRVGFLKPEFVIFDPEDGQTKLNRLRKVSDISQQSSDLDGVLKRRLGTISYSNQNQSSNYQSNYANQMAAPFQYSNEGFADNCSELHLYSEPRASSSSLGRQSMSDAEHYYNFDADPLARQSYGTGAGRLADLVSERSYHQEPIALPMSGNPYLLYMMSLSAGRHQLQANSRHDAWQTPTIQGGGGGKRATERHHNKLKSSTSGGGLTETNELVRIKSNIWGTKFKLINVGNRMIRQRSVLGSVAYKASILHLQPRQIFLTIKDMSNYCCLCSKHHHHTKSQRRPTVASRPAANEGSSRYNNNITNGNRVSLLDMPNLESPVVITPNKLTRRLRKNGSLTKRPSNGADDGDECCNRSKVVLPVGDNIRVAPKLEMNQCYRFSPSITYDSDDDSMPKALRGEARLYFDRKRNEATKIAVAKLSQQPVQADSAGHGKRRHRKNKANSRGCDTDILKSVTYRYPSSATHSGARGSGLEMNDSNGGKDRSNITFKPQASSSRDLCKQQDDILTLSLGQGDQVKVEMSSLRNLDESQNGWPSNTTDGRSSEAEKANDELGKFLATNKTLKSIQTITKMIVDLSSKDDDLEADHAAADAPSPSKMARLSEANNGRPYEQPSTSRFVAPETPVHRPRRVVPRMATGCPQLAGASQLPERARSATSTPLKGVLSSSSSASKRKQYELSKAHVVSIPLPPPPPAIPISRRLSSSAKRFLDGSLRSLYGGGSYSASEAEPEETEHLVVERTFRAKVTRDLLKQPPASHYKSQPSTPVKRSGGAKQFNDLSGLRAQLLQRLRGEKSTALEKFGDAPRKSAWRYNKKGHHQGTSSLNSSGLHLNTEDAPRRKPHHYDLPSSPSASASTSTSSPTSSEDDDDVDSDSTDSELSAGRGSGLHQGSAFKKSAHGCSTSVKDLRDFVRLNRLVGQNKMNGHQQKGKLASGHNNHRRCRRKSMCPNSSCCCAKEFKLNNRPPVWNELSQVYQLDFGGRVTQESAKNLQIDCDGKLALQFGRIDRCTYTLDYKYPFNAVQAMAIALASLTQRLK